MRLIEHVVELRRTAAEGTRRAVWPVVPKQLQERVVDNVSATHSFLREERIGSLRRRQRSVSPPLRHEWEQVVEERNIRNRTDFAVCIPVSYQGVDRIVVAQARLRIADIVELHDVARRENVSCPAPYIARFKRQTFADFAAVREVEAVVVRCSDSLVEGDFNALIFIRRNRKRELQGRRDWTS